MYAFHQPQSSTYKFYTELPELSIPSTIHPHNFGDGAGYDEEASKVAATDEEKVALLRRCDYGAGYDEEASKVAATDEEKVALLRRCDYGGIWIFLIDCLEEADSNLRYPTVEWTGRHPWEIKINPKNFSMKWNKEKREENKFVSLARLLQQYQSTKVGGYTLMRRYFKMGSGIYRFFDGHDESWLPLIDEGLLFGDKKMKKVGSDRRTVYDRKLFNYQDNYSTPMQQYIDPLQPASYGYGRNSHAGPDSFYGQAHIQIPCPSTVPLQMYIPNPNNFSSMKMYAQPQPWIQTQNHTVYQEPRYAQYLVYPNYCMPGMQPKLFNNQEPTMVSKCDTQPVSLPESYSEIVSESDARDSQAIVEGDVTEFFPTNRLTTLSKSPSPATSSSPLHDLDFGDFEEGGTISSDEIEQMEKFGYYF